MKRLRYMIPVFLGFFISFGIFLNINEISIANIVLDFSFASAEYYMAYITEITYWYIPILMSHFLFGTSIYKHFCSASVYYFSRTSKRKRWYCIESLKLYANILIYLTLLLGSSVCLPASFVRKASKHICNRHDIFALLSCHPLNVHIYHV